MRSTEKCSLLHVQIRLSAHFVRARMQEEQREMLLNVVVLFTKRHC